MRASPYQNLPDKAFWSLTAAKRAAEDVRDFYSPRVAINREEARIATAGSCFAQHVGRALRRAGFDVLDMEKMSWVVPEDLAQDMGYGVYSARYGNIYTVRQLRQLLEEALDRRTLAEPVWERGGRFYDAQRPGIEAQGLASPELVLSHRAQHLKNVAHLFWRCNVFVFTFGLTEAWMDKGRTTVYPTAPGTIAGSYDPDRHSFVNFRTAEVVEDFLAVRARLLRMNPAMRFILTVSPVPLTATATQNHVEVATAASKAILRAACAELYDTCPDVDYFPSYEIITAQAAHGSFFEPNLRGVTTKGVATAMNGFLAQALGAAWQGGGEPKTDDELICEDILLEGFAER